MKNKFTDIHHHILYGMDDGAASPEKMREMLRRAAKDNIGRIVATPHVTPGIRRFDRTRYERVLQEAQAFCDTENLGIRIYGGAEIFYSPQTCAFLMDGRVPTLAGTDFVLVEFSPDVRYENMRDALENLLRSGYLPILAHVERYACLVHHIRRAEKLHEELEVCYQVNCGSVLDKHGMGSHRFTEKLLDLDLVDMLGTDAHGPNLRPARMSEAWRKIKKEFGTDYADELTDGRLLFEA